MSLLIFYFNQRFHFARLFSRRRDVEESFANNLQRGGVSGQLSVSHDSVFPVEVPNTRPLSSLEIHTSLEVIISFFFFFVKIETKKNFQTMILHKRFSCYFHFNVHAIQILTNIE